MRFVLKYNNLFQLVYTYTSGCQCKCKRSLDWNNPDGIKCAKETTPVLNMSTQLQVGTDRRVFMVAANVTRSMKVPVYFLNITTLSEYRKDAHTSVYTIRQGKMLTPEQKADPATYADCIHWCLPGLPDTWNEFLYTRIISRSWPSTCSLVGTTVFFFFFPFILYLFIPSVILVTLSTIQCILSLERSLVTLFLFFAFCFFSVKRIRKSLKCEIRLVEWICSEEK